MLLEEGKQKSSALRLKFGDLQGSLRRCLGVHSSPRVISQQSQPYTPFVLANAHADIKSPQQETSNMQD